jgi:hypothetical protein
LTKRLKNVCVCNLLPAGSRLDPFAHFREEVLLMKPYTSSDIPTLILYYTILSTTYVVVSRSRVVDSSSSWRWS